VGGTRPSVRALGAALATVAGLLTIPSAVGPSGRTPTPITSHQAVLAANPTDSRLAYTDDSDFIDETGVLNDPCPTPPCALAPEKPRHEGEVSTRITFPPAPGPGLPAPPPHIYTAFVSTRGATAADPQDADGEVWVRLPNDATGDPDPNAVVQVTCNNTAIESNPVISPDASRIAYASNVSGNYEIYVQPVPGPGAACGSTPQRITNFAGDDLWPTWISNTVLAFSSTRQDPLGDLYSQSILSPDATPNVSTAQRLTNDTAAADTQPAEMTVRAGDGSIDYIVFTTTRFREDGSLAVIPIPAAGAPPPPVTSLWAPTAPGFPPVQSSEAAPFFDGFNTRLLFTTTALDPYGDVRLADVTTDEPPVLQGFGSSIASVDGVAESHGAWSHLVSGEFDSDRFYVVKRSIQADVSDVFSTDGTGRRVLTSGVTTGAEPRRIDESAPSYSGDGRITYSRESTDPNDSGREIVIAAADGSGPTPIAGGRTTHDVDVQPTWSPDGTRIAFVRYSNNGDGNDPGRIMVANLAAGTAMSVSTFNPGAGATFSDEDPSWAPDGHSLVIARNITGPSDLAVAITPAAQSVIQGDDAALTATITNLGPRADTSVFFDVEVPTGLSIVGSQAPCDITNLAGFARIRCTYEEPFLPGDKRVVNLTARGTAPGTHTVTARNFFGDHVPGNDVATAQVTVTPPPDYRVTAFTIPNGSSTGSTAFTTMTATFTNDGGATVGTATVRFRVNNFPDQASLPTGCINVNSTDLLLDCTISPIPPGASTSVAVPIGGPAGTYNASVGVFDVDFETNFANNNANTTFTLATGVPAAAAWYELGNPSNNSSARERPSVFTARPVRLQAPQHPPAAVPLAAAAPVAAPFHSVVRDVPNPANFAQPEIWIISATTGAGAALDSPCGVPPCAPLAGRQPAWSPDGLHIAYTDAFNAIAVATLTDANSDGKPDVPISNAGVAQTTGFKSDGSPTQSRRTLAAAEDPAWSPDGTLLAITGQPAGQPDQRGIYTIRPNGTALTALIQARGPETEAAFEPVADVRVQLAAAPSVISSGANSTLTATVTNAGPLRAAGVTLTIPVPVGLSTVPSTLPPGCSLATATVTCTLGVMAAGSSLVRAFAVRGTAVGTYPVTATVTSTTKDPNLSNNSATVTIRVRATDLAVKITPAFPTAWVGGARTITVTVKNNGPGTAVNARLKMTLSGGLGASAAQPCLLGGAPCNLGTMTAGTTKTFHITLPMPSSSVGARSVTAVVSNTVFDLNLANNKAVLKFKVKKPRLRVLPAVATPGEVVTIFGEDFPPGAQVALKFDKGILAVMTSAVVLADGTFGGPVLILRRDQLGERELIASSPAVPRAFVATKATMLVVPRNLSPPDFLGRG